MFRFLVLTSFFLLSVTVFAKENYYQNKNEQVLISENYASSRATAADIISNPRSV